MRNYQGNNNKNLIVLKTVHQTKDKVDVVPHFQESEKFADETGALKWQTVRADTPLKSFTGELTSVKHERKEFKDEKGKTIFKDSVKLTFDGGDENYLVPLSWRMATRNLFNNMSSLKDFGNVGLSYYRNKAGFETIALYENGELVKEGALTFEQVQGMIVKTMINDDMVSDTSKLKSFLKEKLTELDARIQASKGQPKVEKQEVPIVEDDGSEVPF